MKADLRRATPSVLAQLLGLCLAFGNVPSWADIYVKDQDGVPLFSDRPEGGGFSLYLQTDDLPSASPALASTPAEIRRRMRQYSPLIEQTAHAVQVDSSLLHAVVMVESGYNPNAVSRAGAIGMMQVMPATAARFGKFNLRDPKQNLDVGARYLARLIQMYRGNLELALAAYNAGEHAVERHGNRIPAYRETQRYVPAVLARYHWLRSRGAITRAVEAQRVTPYT